MKMDDFSSSGTRNVVCPKCGSNNVVVCGATVSKIMRPIVILFFPESLLWGMQKERMVCKQCGNTFKN
jgi:hypothetical protein